MSWVSYITPRSTKFFRKHTLWLKKKKKNIKIRTSTQSVPTSVKATQSSKFFMWLISLYLNLPQNTHNDSQSRLAYGRHGFWRMSKSCLEKLGLCTRMKCAKFFVSQSYLSCCKILSTFSQNTLCCQQYLFFSMTTIALNLNQMMIIVTMVTKLPRVLILGQTMTFL